MSTDNPYIVLPLLLLTSVVLVVLVPYRHRLGPLGIRILRRLGFFGADLRPTAFRLPFTSLSIVLDPRRSSGGALKDNNARRDEV